MQETGPLSGGGAKVFKDDVVEGCQVSSALIATVCMAVVLV